MRMVLLSSRYLNAASFKGSNTTIDPWRRDKLTAQKYELPQLSHSSLERKAVTAARTIVRSSLCLGTHKGCEDFYLKVKLRRSIAPSSNVRYDRRHSGLYKAVLRTSRSTWARTMMRREKLAIANIYVPVKRRATLKPDTVREIAQSMLEVGQTTPILVRRDGKRFVQVHGLHRLEACKALGEESILGYLVQAQRR